MLYKFYLSVINNCLQTFHLAICSVRKGHVLYCTVIFNNILRHVVPVEWTVMLSWTESNNLIRFYPLSSWCLWENHLAAHHLYHSYCPNLFVGWPLIWVLLQTQRRLSTSIWFARYSVASSQSRLMSRQRGTRWTALFCVKIQQEIASSWLLEEPIRSTLEMWVTMKTSMRHISL